MLPLTGFALWSAYTAWKVDDPLAYFNSQADMGRLGRARSLLRRAVVSRAADDAAGRSEASGGSCSTWRWRSCSSPSCRPSGGRPLPLSRCSPWQSSSSTPAGRGCRWDATYWLAVGVFMTGGDLLTRPKLAGWPKSTASRRFGRLGWRRWRSVRPMDFGWCSGAQPCHLFRLIPDSQASTEELLPLV